LGSGGGRAHNTISSSRPVLFCNSSARETSKEEKNNNSQKETAK
jgi:hypothetical protein